MLRETKITVPTEDAEFISDALAEAGVAVLDTGQRIGTDEGPEAEAVLCVAELETDPEAEGQANQVATPVRP